MHLPNLITIRKIPVNNVAILLNLLSPSIRTAWASTNKQTARKTSLERDSRPRLLLPHRTHLARWNKKRYAISSPSRAGHMCAILSQMHCRMHASRQIFAGLRCTRFAKRARAFVYFDWRAPIFIFIEWRDCAVHHDVLYRPSWALLLGQSFQMLQGSLTLENLKSGKIAMRSF